MVKLMDARVPFCAYQSCVQPDWIDYNGHMNVAYYVLAFDQATDAFNSNLDLGPEYVARTRKSLFVVDMNVTYRRELKEGARISCTTQLLEFDAKKVRLFHQMFQDDEGFLAATNELIMVHVDLETGKSCPFPEATLERLQAMARQHQSLAIPENAGRVLSL
ncbi:thioesterase-like protein [Motiliproteus coralliicola]|uniref:Thioesterase-like protein n=2 Tax=Motiliproteus coralliicola TaxID=2283196 RepID=A0A369WKC5_9GAMM|nr:thioesterase-like protein [Motiliproteus coralliicola]